MGVLSAGMHLVAVDTPFTHQSLLDFDQLTEESIVEVYEKLPAVVAGIVESNREKNAG